MGRQPRVWEFHGHRIKWWREKRKDITNVIAKFDIEQLELLPFSERRGRPRKRNWRLNSPVQRYLMQQIGRDYDEVFSELAAITPHKYHNCENIGRYKMPSSFHPDSTRWFADDDRGRRTSGFYVDLESRTLCYEAPLGFHHIQAIERAKPVYVPFSVTQFKVVRCTFKHPYVFNQLLVYEDFENEAFKMKHCIRQYWHRCVHLPNESSIWSLSNGKDKVMTIEVYRGIILQVRGLSNREATEEEQKVIVYWAEWMKMTITDYAF